MRRFRVPPALALFLMLSLGFLLGLAKPFVLRPPLLAGQDAVPPASPVPARAVNVEVVNVGGPVLRIVPADGARAGLLILYPGALVRPQAYEWLGRALAQDGVETLIPAFPADLAVLGVNRADALIGRFGAGRRVVLAGHSLGGAMAASYAARHAGKVNALILMAAYPAGNVNLRDQPLRVLSLLAERDGVADAADVRGGLNRLPDRARLSVIPGAVHSFFGRYGPQAGDGTPTVTRAEAETAILSEVRAFLREPALSGFPESTASYTRNHDF